VNVVIGTPFRNAARHLPMYFSQVAALSALLQSAGHTLHLIAVEGDSTDQTFHLLQRRLKTGLILRRSHGGPAWGSVDDPNRWIALGWVCNGILENVPFTADAVIYVDADLNWDARIMLRLLQNLQHVPAVSPLVVVPSGEFYNTWAFRLHGQSFSPHPPFHPALRPDQLNEVDSTGSCIALRGTVARRVRFGFSDFTRGLCRNIREAGFSVWLDPQARVVQA
jgi:hypothetical protein